MPKYFYIARNSSGNKTSGTEEAANPEEAISHIQEKGLILVNIIPESKDAQSSANLPTGGKGKSIHRHNRISGDDLTLFCRQIATLLGAGVTILKTLDIISRQVASKRLFKVIKDLEKNMESGASFHEAMAKYPQVFSELWVNLVESGEASGNLAIVFSRLASYLERDAAFKKKIVSALIYPAILMVVGTAALLFLTIKIIPTFAEIFKGFNIELPLLTQILMSISEFIKGYFLFISIAVVILAVLFKKFIGTKPGRRKFEQFLFNLPLFGEFFKVLVAERFTSEMSTLVESGVPILYSLEIVEHSVDSLIVGDIVRKVKEDVREGKSLSEPLEKSGFFDPMAVQMISIGEEIGELSNMFKRLNAFYQEHIDTFLTRFTSMFEPIMLVFMGGIIGLMVIGMFLPIFQITKIGGQ